MLAGHRGMRTWPWRTITVVAYGAALVIQGYLSFTTTPEPYPSIRMPNFGLAASPDGTLGATFTRAQYVDKDGSVRPISATELMSEFRFSTARPSYDYLFRSASQSRITPAVREWLRQRIIELNPGANPSEFRACWQDSRVSLVDASIIPTEACVWKAIPL
jgi:hypothetical protein